MSVETVYKYRVTNILPIIGIGDLRGTELDRQAWSGAHEAMTSTANRASCPPHGYAAKREQSVQRFWRRLGGRPDFRGATVLDLGCGNGELSRDIVRAGAHSVLGIDIERRLVDRASQLSDADGTADVATFQAIDIAELEGHARFDAIVSRDTFEHIDGFDARFSRIVALLKPGGRLYVGFGPLYHSPFGGHRRMRMFLPWMHLLLPERAILAWVRLFHGADYRPRSVREMGLNQLTVHDFERVMCRRDGLATVFWQVNHGDNRISRAFRWLGDRGLARRWISHDIYAVLEKPR